MPTTQVRPEDSEALQVIANALVKAKKVVVVTGAGISTNSGIPDFRSENGLYQLIQAQYVAAARLAAQPQVPALESASSSSRDDASNIEEFPTDQASKRRKLSSTEREESGTSSADAENASTEDRRSGRRNDDRRRKSTRMSQPNAAELKTEDSIVVKHDASDSQNTSTSDLPLEKDEEPGLLHNVPDSPSFQLSQEALDQSLRNGRANSLPPEFQSPPRSRALLTVPQSSPLHYSKRDFPFIRQSRPVNLSLDTSQSSSSHGDFCARWASWAASGHDLPPSPPLQPLSVFPATPTHVSTIRTPINPHHRRVLASLAAESPHLSDPPLFCSSSPLSSPPPILFDPLDESPSSPQGSSFGSNSSLSETDDPPPSSNPVTSSQTSTLSAKLPIPNIKGRDLFDASIWTCPIRTSVFYTFATTLRQKARDVSPTTSHQFIGHLRDRGKLVRCYTQNIDRIEEKVGLTTSLDRGPGQRSRFSNRRSTLSRLNSAATSKEASTLSEDGQCSGGDASTGDDRGSAPGSQSVEVGQGSQHDPPVPANSDVSGQSSTGGMDHGSPVCRTGSPTEATRMDGGNSSKSGDGFVSLSGSPSGRPEGLAIKDEQAPEASRPSGSALSKLHPSRAASSQVCVTVNGTPSGDPKATEAQEESSSSASDASQETSGASAQGSQAQTSPKSGGPPEPRHSPPSSGVECVLLHGSLESLRCFLCRKLCEWDGDDRENETLSGQQPECPHCAGATAARQERGKRALGIGKLRPDIVLYGEEHPNAHLISPVVTHDLGLGPDLLLILGTSLKVHGLKVMVRQFAKAVHTKGGKVVFINFTKPPESTWGDVIDYWIQWDCDAWVENLKERVPILWLPPGTTLPEPPKKRKRESTGEKKKTTKKAPLKKEKTGEGASDNQNPADGSMIEDASAKDSIVASWPTDTSTDKPITDRNKSVQTLNISTEQSDEPLAKESANPSKRTPQKSTTDRSKGIREDKANGAYLTWKIMDNLRRLSGRPAPPPMELPSLAATRAAAAAATRIKRNEAARLRRQRKSAPAALARPEPSELDGTITKPEPLATPQSLNPAVSQSAPIAISFNTPMSLPQPQQASILAAVKSNPRRRKRKTIDGEEVVLPCVNSRGSFLKQQRQATPASRGSSKAPYQPQGKENNAAGPWISTTPIPIPHVPHSRRPISRGSPQPPNTARSHSKSRPLPRDDRRPESLRLAPLRQPISPTHSQSLPFPKPEPMEPPVSSPRGPMDPLSSPRGPLSTISANLRSSLGDLRGNPFFFSDPSVRWSGPPWEQRGAGGGAGWS